MTKNVCHLVVPISIQLQRRLITSETGRQDDSLEHVSVPIVRKPKRQFMTLPVLQQANHPAVQAVAARQRGGRGRGPGRPTPSRV